MRVGVSCVYRYELFVQPTDVSDLMLYHLIFTLCTHDIYSFLQLSMPLSGGVVLSDAAALSDCATMPAHTYTDLCTVLLAARQTAGIHSRVGLAGAQHYNCYG